MKYLIKDNIPTRQTSTRGWIHSSIRDILADPAYKGTMYVNLRRAHKASLKEIPKDAMMIPVAAIVDENTWQTAQDIRHSAKHLYTEKKRNDLLQGIMTCGICGRHFRCDTNRGRRRYFCRGKLGSNHMDGSPRCTSPRFDAEWLEAQVWDRVEAILLDPNKLEGLIKETIADSEHRIEELSHRIKPIDTRLAQIAQQKSRLADDWVRANMSPDKFRQMQEALDLEEDRLRKERGDIDPAQIEELEQARAIVHFWDARLRDMVWNLENEDGTKVRTVEGPHKTVLSIVGFEDKDAIRTTGFPPSRRQVLEKLQVSLEVFHDRVEVNAMIPIEAIPLDCQLASTACRERHREDTRGSSGKKR